MSLPVIASAAVSLIAVWAVYNYNLLVDARAKVREAMRGVDAQLKHRHEIVPNINGVIRAYVEHEHDATRAAAAQRSRAIGAKGTEQLEVEENALSGEISHLLSVVEEYPNLRVQAQFIALSEELYTAEDELHAAADLFNASVEHYNSKAHRIPTSLISMWLTPKSFDELNLEPVEFDMVRTRVGEFAA